MVAKGFSYVFLSLGKRLSEAAQQRPPVCGSFVVANAHIADDNLKNLELRSEIVARVTQTARQHKGVTILPEQPGRANWTSVLPYFRID
jgi:hypothetical protein